MSTDSDEVFRLLLDSNPWWDSGRVPSSLTQAYRRRDFFVLREELKERPILGLGGPRQVGKTTVLYQIIEHLLSSGINPSRILFVSLDLPGLSTATNHPLNDCLGVYAERILGRAWREIGDRVYVILDEITRASQWDRDLKGWFDFHYPIKFLISSSSLSELKEGSSRSLSGRISTHLLMTWKFVDALMFSTRDESWNDTGLRLREALASAVDLGDADVYMRTLRHVEAKSVRERSRLRSTLDRYLLTDGFPELLAFSDLARCAKRLREYLDLTVANDLDRVFKVRSTGLFYDLLGYVARESGQLVSYHSLAETLNVEVRTVSDYLGYLESVYFISRAEFFSQSRAKRIRRQRKILVPNPGIQNILLGRLDRKTLTDPALVGRLAEAVVHEHAKRLVYCLNPGPEPKSFYWRDRQNREVDVVVSIANKSLPIEVKYRTEPRRDLEGLRAFLDHDKSAPFGLVVTRDLLALDGNTLFLPLSHFLLTA
jgi:uncharacterized protein